MMKNLSAYFSFKSCVTNEGKRIKRTIEMDKREENFVNGVFPGVNWPNVELVFLIFF